MILHDLRLIFIHIPKNAGSSIETLFGVKPFDWKIPNYDVLTGWCPKRCIHLQHATPKQLLETGLISEDIWDSYYKFAIVRNSWERSLSDYIWMLKSTGVSGSFKEYLNREGKFKYYLLDTTEPVNRVDHIIPQVDFTHMKNKPVLDEIISFDNLSEGFQNVCEHIGIDSAVLPHIKKGVISQKHYSYFYNDELKNLVSEIYHEDIQAFNFEYIDKRPIFDRILPIPSLRLELLKTSLSRR
jgi:hypothetical protein